MTTATPAMATTPLPATPTRIGHGFDVHAFAEGRPLVLGGVSIASPRGLAGHSDADVLTHALMDALLGAARIPGAGDIGQIFPDNDPAFEGADSIELLRRVCALVREAGWQIIDADCTVAAQAPKLSPHREAMRARLAEAMGVSLDHVGVKATTTEHLGFVGREEGIAAWSVVLLG
jgi:2-C-methyl-D-erythritol 2,4-cyclodiphosphate synthase